MKISKVNHTKTAVAIKKEVQKGVVYKDPAEGSEMDLNSHIDKLVKQTKRLRRMKYDIFNMDYFKKDKGEIKGAKKDAKAVNELINNEVIKKNRTNPDIKQLANNLRIDRVTAEYIVNNALRKALSKAHTRAAIMLFMSNTGSNCNLTDAEIKQIQKDFIDVMWNDCNCKGIKENVIKSISHQNMIIQPINHRGQTILAPSRINKQKTPKAERKDAFRDMLYEYATVEKEDRMDMLRKLRRLLVLYFYGINEVPKDIFSVWENHSNGSSNNLVFVDCEFKTDDNGNKRKDNEKVTNTQLKDRIRSENIRMFKESKDAVNAEQENGLFFDNPNLNMFWLNRFSSMVEKIFSKRIDSISDYKLSRGYVAEKVWKDSINYLSIKYISIGKAVYNAATTVGENDINIGVIREAYENGISSFDYEMIKAEEELQRETAVYVSFAVNNLSRASINLKAEKKSGDEDILSFEEAQINRLVTSDAQDRILRFFGGKSRWDGFDFSAYAGEENNESTMLFNAIRGPLRAMRNDSFHFFTLNKDQGSWNKELLSAMFEYDANKYGSVIKNKFYSNNLPAFYKTSVLEETLHKLYDKPADKATQMPSFNKVLVRNSFPNYLRDKVKTMPVFDVETMMMWQSSVYYLLKEIYYNKFISDPHSKELFLKAVINIKAKEDDKRAADDFKRKVKIIEEYSLPEICQIIMTEQNKQNQGNKKKRTAKDEKNRPSIFKHYKLLLHACLREAFSEYWITEYDFISSPILKDKPTEEEFLPEFKCARYEDLKKKVKSDIGLQKWYVLSRMINPKQVNQLSGAVRSFIQYVWDIQRRAGETGIGISRKPDGQLRILLERALEIIDISVQLSGTTSNQLKDYYADEDAYASFVMNYLNYDNKLFPENISPSGKLKAFCNQGNGEQLSVFYDGENPILNRNIVLADLYGDTKLLSAVLQDTKVSYEDIKRLKDNEKEISKYKATGLCKTLEERKKLSEFQTLKNHVEFRDLVEYTELIDELQAQMINWAYLRERDLMYFQLGFHYICLMNDNCKNKYYKSLPISGNRAIDNAVLYQILAMYTNGLPLYTDEEGNACKATASAGKKISSFLDYSKLITPDNDEAVYSAGLELFETYEEHDNIVMLRNYIDHFKYYELHNRSILDLYSEIFDRFFSYDEKYKKNVVNLLYNILLKHFVITKFTFATGEKTVGKGDNTRKKEMAKIQFDEKSGVMSEEFTYKLDGKESVKVYARGKQFLNNVARILCYPNAVPEKVVEEISHFYEKGTDRQNKENNGNNHADRDQRRRRDYRSSDERIVYRSKPEPKGETAFERALRLAREKEAAKKK